MKRQLWNKITAVCIVLFLACLGLAAALCFNFGTNSVSASTASTEEVGINSTVASVDGESAVTAVAYQYEALSATASAAADSAGDSEVTAPNPDDYGEITYLNVANKTIISDGKLNDNVLDSLPDGISYNDADRILIIDGASYSKYGIYVEGGSLTITISGESTFGRFYQKASYVVMQGGGTLNLGSSGTDKAIDMHEDGCSLIITDGVTINAYGYSSTVFCYENGYIAVTGGAVLNAQVAATQSYPYAIWLDGSDLVIDGGTVAANIVDVYGGSSLTIREGGALDLTIQAADFTSTFSSSLTIRNGSTFTIDGGEFNFDRTATTESKTMGHVYIGDADSSFILNSGSVNVFPHRDYSIIDINNDGLFIQTGGELYLGNLFYGSGDFYFLGGTAKIKSGLQTEGDVVINGGSVSISNSGYAINIYSSASFIMLGGELSVENTSADWGSALYCNGGYVYFFGGETVLESATGTIAVIYSNISNAVQLSSGINCYDGNGESLSLDSSANVETVISTATNKAVICGDGGVFSSAMSITSSNITVGTSFTMMHAASFAATDGTVSYVIPEGLVFYENSLTVNSVVSDYIYSGNTLTVNISGASYAVIRFSTTATAAGSYVINAKITVNGGEYSDSCTFKVKAFSISIPTQTSRTTIPLSGTAAVESVITFYNGSGYKIGTASVNSLGSWSTSITIDDSVGEQQVYAVITLAGGEKITSDIYTINYDPDCEEVSTLTMTNVYHGQTSVDPDITGKLIINYIDGTTSASYYTYDPNHPTFNYEVAFTKDADKMNSVYVVTTNVYGGETAVALTYNSLSDTWTGSYDYDEFNCPALFRVVWEKYEDEQEAAEEETEQTENETQEESYDYALYLTAETYFTFGVENPEYLTLTDAAGKDVSFSYSYSDYEEMYIIYANFSADMLYIAELSQGTFPEYPDYSELCIMIEGSDETSGYYEYNDCVIEVDELGSLSDYSVGDVIIVADSYAYVVTENGFEEAGLEDIYSELYVTENDMLPDEAWVEVDEEAIVAEFKKSSMYEAAVAALSLTLSNEIKTTVKGISIKLGYEAEFEKGKGTYKLAIEVSLGSEAAGASITVEYKIEDIYNLKIEKEKGEWGYFYLGVDQTQTISFTAKVYAKGEESSDLSKKLEAYFYTENDSRSLEKLKEATGSEKQESKPVSFRIPTSVPGLFIKTSLSFAYEVELSGDLGVTAGFSFNVKYGINCNHFHIKTFRNFDRDSKTYTLGAEGHAQITEGIYLVVKAGVTIFDVLDADVSAKIGPELTIAGHGTYSYDSNQQTENELEIAVSFDLAFKLEAEIKFNLPKKLQDVEIIKEMNENLKVTIFEAKINLWKSESVLMPYKFTDIEEETIYVTNGSDLSKLVSLYVCNQEIIISSDETAEVNKLYDMEHYSFEIVSSNPYGITISSDGVISVPSGINERVYFSVRVNFDYAYNLYKTVTLCYAPATITVFENLSNATGGSTYTVTDNDTGEILGSLTTNSNGVGTFPVEENKSYTLTMECCIDGYEPLIDSLQINSNEVAEIYDVNPEITKKTQDEGSTGLGDPSGYVYEGAEQFRLSGVKTTIYYSANGPDDDGNVTDAVIWSASEYGQTNPLITNSMGEYCWDVPTGWWQVVYEKDGYETAYSEWLPVPPVQTGVNVNLITYDEAQLITVAAEDNIITFKFTHPITASSLNSTFTVYYNGTALAGNIVYADSAVAEDGTMLVMAFYFIAERSVDIEKCSVEYTVVTYAGTVCSVSLGLEISATVQQVNISYVTADGITVADYEVTISAGSASVENESLDWGNYYLPQGYNMTDYSYSEGALVVSVEKIVTEDAETPEDPEEPDDPVDTEDPEEPIDPDDTEDHDGTEDPDDTENTGDTEDPDNSGNDDDVQEPTDGGSSDDADSHIWIIAVVIGVAALAVICGAVVFIVIKKKK